jgi:hypothetical protein
VSIDDERDVRAWLGATLDDIDPGPVPLDGIMRKGRTVVLRRRLVMAGAAAAVLAVAVAAPVLAHRFPASPSGPAAPARYQVTVSPPGPGAPRGLIAAGRVNGRHWQVSGQRQPGSGQPTVCFAATSAEVACYQNGLRASHTGDPAELSYGLGARPLVTVGTVRADVAYLRVTLGNGQMLTLRPVAILGPGYARFVAFAVPASTVVTQISAYSRRAELAYAVPFTGWGQVETVRWLRPGAAASPRPAKYLIGSGDADGQRWSEYAYTGPWGVCLGGAGYGGTCEPVGIGQLTGGQAASLAMVAAGRGGTNYAVVAATPAVSYLLVTRADGSTARVATTRAGSARFAAFTSPPGNKVTHWAAYSAAGRRLASGRLP